MLHFQMIITVMVSTLLKDFARPLETVVWGPDSFQQDNCRQAGASTTYAHWLSVCE